jgi:hypothetical protein
MIEYRFKITGNNLATTISMWIVPFEELTRQIPIHILQITPYGDDAFVLMDCENFGFEEKAEPFLSQFDPELYDVPYKVELVSGFPFED